MRVCKEHNIAECATCTERPPGVCDWGACWEKATDKTAARVSEKCCWKDLRESCEEHTELILQLAPNRRRVRLKLDKTKIKTKYFLANIEEIKNCQHWLEDCPYCGS